MDLRTNFINANQHTKADHLNSNKTNGNGIASGISGLYLSQENKDKNSTSNSNSSSNFINIAKNSNSNYNPVSEQKPLQSTRDFRVIFLGKPFDMVI